jgi:arginyl-tRNA synthetase
MYSLKQAKNEILDFLRSQLDGLEVSYRDLEPPPNRAAGDLAYACFPAAKQQKRNPAELAAELAGRFQAGGLVASVTAAGPYLNFKFDRIGYSQGVIQDVLAAPEQWGHTPADDRDQVMVEYAQPNTHKELHVGHLRNLTLGLAIVNLWRAVGRQVIPVAYIGDVGAHVAKCLWCLRNFHADEIKQPPTDKSKGAWLGEIYAEATQRIGDDEKLKGEVAELQRQLEAGDPELTALWQQTREWSLEEFRQVFGELGVDLERWYYESDVEQAGKDTAKEMLAQDIAEVGERGALIVDLEEQDLGKALILKSDGSALYMTKELALAKLKFQQYPEIGHSIHIVDSRQSLYFKQFFAMLKLLGFDRQLTHLAYEFVTLKDGAMSSRTGNVVTYQQFRNEIVARAEQEVEKRHADWDPARRRTAAWQVAEAAMTFGMLKQDPDKPIVFDIESALAFDGFSGPYLQYAHARLASILRKAEWSPTNQAPADGSPDEDELAVLTVAARLPEVVRLAAQSGKPSQLAQYLFDLAQAISQFYRDVPVLNAENETDRQRRLQITECLRVTLAQGLNLLGIQAPGEM